MYAFSRRTLGGLNMKHLFIFDDRPFYYNACDMNDYLFSIRRTDLVGSYNSEYLVRYYHNEVYVDQNAPLWYRKFATIHEYIYMEDCYIAMFGDIPKSEDRRALIDIGIYKYLCEELPVIADDYLYARLGYYNFLIDEDIDTSQSIRASRTRLREFIHS